MANVLAFVLEGRVRLTAQQELSPPESFGSDCVVATALSSPEQFVVLASTVAAAATPRLTRVPADAWMLA